MILQFDMNGKCQRHYSNISKTEVMGDATFIHNKGKGTITLNMLKAIHRTVLTVFISHNTYFAGKSSRV